MKALAVINAILIIASIGGYEQGMFSFTGLLVRLAVFSALIGFSIVADEIFEQKKRAKRMAVRKAHSNN